jgi:poly(hydroxyalkanoate) depolymerase family esterase
MRSLNDTINRLAAQRARSGHGLTAPAHDRLTELLRFGSNPGALRGWSHVPETLKPDAALVVVLHGCTQTAAGYDHGSGWSQLADELGFALLFAEQQRGNNPNLCFNWFAPEDARRDGGEALSIRQMVAAMVAAHPIDPGRIFVTGLSAGGAMTSVMLATYPEVFAGGAVVAGLPFACARSVPEAFDRMRGHGLPAAEVLAASVRAASPHSGPWPRLSVWHGGGDKTVSPVNARAVIDQWRALHDLPHAPSHEEMVDGYPHRLWIDADGVAVIEEYSIPGMGHGTPLSTLGEHGCGVAGPYMLETGISSTRHIARFWGLGGAAWHVGSGTTNMPTLTDPLPNISGNGAADPLTSPAARSPASPGGVGKAIEDALRSAGLMR